MYESDYIVQPIHEGLYVATVWKDVRPNRELGPQEVKGYLISRIFVLTALQISYANKVKIYYQTIFLNYKKCNYYLKTSVIV